MILLEPEHTPYDLRFSAFGIPVRVHPLFWLFTAILGFNTTERGFQFLVMWIVCVFVSILVHELGHVFMGMLFGSYGHIVLHSFGGLAIGSSNLPSRWQRIAVYFAGPFAGFLLFGATLIALVVVGGKDMNPLLEAAIDNLIWINLIWGILNLFPIWPLDGGQISRDFLDWLSPGNGLRVSLWISICCAALMGALFLYGRMMFSTLMFAMLAFSSYQMLQQLPSRRTYERDLEERTPWERDDESWRR